ncbi:hypothetical protein BDQ17DRAFT_1434324 [Cyathus striatus]|nr:hypothetical protein BDQ17DRAFT_1434324 [Cyathus striatus]
MGKGDSKGKGRERRGKGKKELDDLQVNGETQSLRRNGKGYAEGGRVWGVVWSGVAMPVVEEEKVPVRPATPAMPSVNGALDVVVKKMRNLNKKLKAIEELKEKAKRGERLEAFTHASFMECRAGVSPALQNQHITISIT